MRLKTLTAFLLVLAGPLYAQRGGIITSGGGYVPLTGGTITCATTSADCLTLKTTDDNTTKRLLQLKSSANADLGGWGATGNLFLVSGATQSWNGDLFQGRRAAATLNLGAADVDTNASIVAQSLTVQSALTGGTADQAGKDFTISGSQGKGTGAGGKIILKAAGAGNTGTTVNTLNTILTLQDSGTAGTSAPQILAANGTAPLPSNAYANDPDTGWYSTDQNGSIGFTGNGTLRVAMTVGGNINLTGQLGFGSATAPTGILSLKAAANLRLGAADAASPVAQTLSSQGSRGGNDPDTAAPAGGTTIVSPLGTGLAAGDQLNLSRGLMTTTGSASHAAAHAFTVCESKTLSNTTATTTTIATVGLASNSAGGLTAMITVTATDGTNFDSETQTVNVSYVNKATVMTVGTPAISASTAANNSGSATIGATVTGASPTISLKVTPVFTTIVPTIVTSYVEIFNHGAGAVACQ